MLPLTLNFSPLAGIFALELVALALIWGVAYALKIVRSF